MKKIKQETFASGYLFDEVLRRHLSPPRPQRSRAQLSPSHTTHTKKKKKKSHCLNPGSGTCSVAYIVFHHHQELFPIWCLCNHMQLFRSDAFKKKLNKNAYCHVGAPAICPKLGLLFNMLQYTQFPRPTQADTAPCRSIIILDRLFLSGYLITLCCLLL